MRLAPGGLRSVSSLRLPLLAAYWLGLSFLWGALSTVILPVLIEQTSPQAVQGTRLAIVAALQALVAIVVQPLSGAASDGLTTRWGRRRPLMVVGVALQLICLALLVEARSYVAVLAVIILVELFSNLAQGPYQGLLPDTVPRGRRGPASALLGAAQLGGQVIGVAVAGAAVAAGELELAIVACGVAVALGAATTIAGVPEAGATPEPVGRLRERRPRSRLLDVASWRLPVRATILRVWGRDVLHQRDYLWVLGSRLAILMATGTLQPFVYFFLRDSIGLGAQAASAVAPLAGVIVLVAVVSTLPGGALTQRWGRVRTVRVAALVGAVGALAFSVAPGYESLFVIGIPFGAALGLFLSADWALLADLVPQDEAGRYLGLSNTVTAGAAMLAVAIGGPLADVVNGWSLGLGYRAVFVLAAVEFLVGAWALVRVHEPPAPVAVPA